MKSLQNGFTLIEMLVTIVIVGILSSVAYSSYLNSVATTKAGIATAEVERIASDFETYYTENGNYFGATVNFENEDYEFRALTCEQNPHIYRLEAEPKESSVAYDKGTLVQDSTGERIWIPNNSDKKMEKTETSWCSTANS